jgi:hypothetical protein
MDEPGAIWFNEGESSRSVAMPEPELRQILRDVIADIDAGRVDVRPRRRRGRWLGSSVVAAALGLAGGALGAGCEQHALGVDRDAAVDAGSIVLYGIARTDAALDAAADAEVDGGNVDLYGVILEDGGSADAALDAAVDGDIPLPYAAPPIAYDTRFA